MLTCPTRAPCSSLPALPALVVAPVQALLGDDEERHERRLVLNEEVNTKIQALGTVGMWVWLVLCIIRIIIMYFCKYRALLAVFCIIRINIYYVFIMYSVLPHPEPV